MFEEPLELSQRAVNAVVEYVNVNVCEASAVCDGE